MENQYDSQAMVREEITGQNNQRWELDVSDWLLSYKLGLQGFTIDEKGNTVKTQKAIINEEGAAAVKTLIDPYCSHLHILGNTQEWQVKDAAKECAMSILDHLIDNFKRYKLELGDLPHIALGAQTFVEFVLRRGVGGAERNYKQPKLQVPEEYLRPVPQQNQRGFP